VNRYTYLLAIVICSLSTQTAHADTRYEIQVSTHALFFDISEKRGPRYSDDFNNAGIGFAAYRSSGRNTSWGAVVEFATAIDRDAEFGDGKMMGFRPVNFLYAFNDRLFAEIYLGAAQYKWEKTARGYYLGSNIRWNLQNKPIALAFDYRFHQDMAYDSALGDVIVQGPSVGLMAVYHF